LTPAGINNISKAKTDITTVHWHRLVKNTGGANQNIGGATGDKKFLINAWMFLNYWGGARPGCPPKSTPMQQ